MNKEDNQWIYQIAEISHELRTPLNAIKGFGDLLDKEVVGPLNEKQHLYLKKILTGADDLLIIINQVLDWAKLSSNQITLNKEMVNLYTLSLEMQSLFDLRASRENIEFVTQVPKDAIIFADMGRIKQVLVNLIDNALKFTPSQGRIELNVKADENKYICCLEDTGRGMSTEVANNIFNPFDIGSGNRETDGHGSGLGLWVSRAIVEAHGGKLYVESKQGIGSRFYMILPRE